MALLIYERDQLLLRKSETIKKHPLILQVLDEYKGKKLYYKDLANLDEEAQRELKQIEMIRKSAELEFEPLSKTDCTPNKDKYVCARCDKKNLVHIRFIRNKITKEEYSVGRECIEHVRDLFLKHGIDLDAMEKEDERIKRAMDIDDKFNDIRFIIENWNEVLEKSPIMIINNIELPFINAKRELKLAYTKCVDNHINDQDMSIIETIYNQRNGLFESIEKYIRDNKDNEWIATRNIEQWLIRNKYFTLLNKLKQTGIITKETAGDIYERRFMKLISNKLRIVFWKKGIAGWEPRPDEKGYLIKVQDIHLIVNHKQIIQKYWNYIYNELVCSDFDFKDILDISIVCSKDYDKCEKELRKYFYMSKLAIHSMNHARDEVIIREKGVNNKYLRYRFIPFIDKCKYIIFNIPNIDIDKIQNEIITTSLRKYDFEEIQSYENQMQRAIFEAGRITKRKAKGR